MMALKIGDFVDAVDLCAPDVALPLPERWYLLRVHPHRETKVMRTFNQRGISGYMPMVPRTRKVTRTTWLGRHVEQQHQIRAPLFPGVILLPDFELSRRRLRDVDGVIGLFQMGDCTPYLSHEDMAQVRALEAAGNTPLTKLKRLYEVGQIVKIVDGPFAGWQGRVERLDSNGRLSVLLSAMKRGHKVNLTECQIEPASDCDRSRNGSTAAQSLRRHPSGR